MNPGWYWPWCCPNRYCHYGRYGIRPPKSQNKTLYNPDAGACNSPCSKSNYRACRNRISTREYKKQNIDTRTQADYQLKSTSTVSPRSSSLSLLPSLITLPPGGVCSPSEFGVGGSGRTTSGRSTLLGGGVGFIESFAACTTIIGGGGADAGTGAGGGGAVLGVRGVTGVPGTSYWSSSGSSISGNPLSRDGGGGNLKSFRIVPVCLRRSAIFRARVVGESYSSSSLSSSSWSEGSEAGRGSIRAMASASDERLRGVSPCGCPGTWLKKELLRNGGLLGLDTGAGIGLTSRMWMGGDC